MFAGYSSIPTPIGGGGSFDGFSLAQAIKLHANGIIRIDGKANYSAATYVPACANDFGKLVRCGGSSWTIGGPGGEEAINGSCTNYPSEYASQPGTNTANGCTAGSYSDTGDTATTWRWQCLGQNGGSTSTCIADKASIAAPVNGSCGVSNGGTFSSTPSAGLCSTGTPSGVANNFGDPEYTWSCLGSNGGSDASCYANGTGGGEPAVGSCGSAEGGTYPEPPSSNLCAEGTATEPYDSGKGIYVWMCEAAGGDVECNANVGEGGGGGEELVTGSCGSAEGGTYPEPPSSNLCSAGSPTEPFDTGRGFHYWICEGANGGGDAECTANVG